MMRVTVLVILLSRLAALAAVQKLAIGNVDGFVKIDACVCFGVSVEA